MMTIYSIADLHLDTGDKPMDVFGPNWTGHFSRISKDWRARVGEEDAVLLPGDFSWAMTLDEARVHIAQVGALPGRKVLVKGNHDYWWGSISRVREALPEGMYAIQNDALELGGVLFAGTRGWMIPGENADPDDVRIYERELLRLEMTLSRARMISRDKRLIALMHYPPLTPGQRDTAFTRLMQKYAVDTAVYGHLHGASAAHAFEGTWEGITYHLVSCDKLGFELMKL